MTKPSIVIGTKSWLDGLADNGEVLPPGFVAYRRNRGTHGGGVCFCYLLIWDILQSVPLDVSQQYFEYACCKDGKCLSVGSF